MARSANFSYQNPMADIGGSLGRAIFGDPQAAALQRKAQEEAALRAAQAEQATQHAALFSQQATAQHDQNTAAVSLPELFARLGAPAQQVPRINDPAFLEGVGTQPPVPTDMEQFRGNLAPAVAAMAQMRGETVDPRQIIGTLASFFGGDEMARRGLVAQGHTPGAAFALTPERADDIAGQGYASREQVATINNRDDVPVAQIRSGDSRYATNARERSSNFATSTRASTSREVADARAAAARDKAARKEADQAAARRINPISVSAAKRIDKLVEEQLDARGLQSPPAEDGTPGATRLDPGVHTWVRIRANEEFRRSGNAVDATNKAIRAALAASKSQKAARDAKRAPPASRSRGTGERRLTVEQAAKLPRGTRFVGLDGDARWRH